MAQPRRGTGLALTVVAALTLGLGAPSALASGMTDEAQPTSSSTATEETSAETAVEDLVTATPTVSGELAVGQDLTAIAGAWSPEYTLSYRWLAEGVAVPGATEPTFTLTTAQAGARVQVEVTGTLPDGTSTIMTSDPGLRVVVAGTPTVAGRTAVGSTLTATTGNWTPGTAYTYQWLADGVDIPGATGSSLLLAVAQSGKAISVRVTGAQPDYPTVSRVSAETATRVMRWTTPSISGSVAVGSTLTAMIGHWTWGAAHTYQWYANGVGITGARDKTFTVPSTQKDKRITVKVTGRKDGHLTISTTSAATAKVMTAGTPKISGIALSGRTLTATPGTWTPYATLSYQWYADGAAIAGATTSKLALTSGHKDKKITVKVTGRRSGWATVTKTSAATLRVQIAPAAKISGTPRVTYTLTAVAGTWSAGTAFTYQWYANGSALSGRTAKTLTLGTSQVGKKITVKITGRKSGYPTVSRLSPATAVVGYPSSTTGYSDGNCPSWAPIKGNANSMIYHMPTGRYYSVTKAEECFRTETAAVAAGYRKSKL